MYLCSITAGVTHHTTRSIFSRQTLTEEKTPFPQFCQYKLCKVFEGNIKFSLRKFSHFNLYLEHSAT